jgi:hypothetical protein
MKLTPATEYATRLTTAPMSDVQPLSEILIAGVGTKKIIEGATLEAALRWNDYVLLFLTDDIPFEETLNIYLLDRDANVIDLARMYHIYATGVFSDLDLSEPDAVRFRFFGGRIWTLRLFTDRTFALPFFADPIGVHRPCKFSRMFALQSQPG